MEVESILNSQEPSEIQMPMCVHGAQPASGHRAHALPQHGSHPDFQRPLQAEQGFPRRPPIAHLLCTSAATAAVFLTSTLQAACQLSQIPALHVLPEQGMRAALSGRVLKAQEKPDFLLPSLTYR